MHNSTPIIIISTGDPAGIGPEITLKALTHFTSWRGTLIVPVGDSQVFSRAQSLLKLSRPLLPVSSIEEAQQCRQKGIPFFPVTASPGLITGEPSRQGGESTVKILQKAFSLCMEEDTHRALVTCPINKQSIRLAGLQNVGHTEILRQWSKAQEVETVFCLLNLRVFFLSRHMGLKTAIDFVRKDHIVKAIRRVNYFMKKLGFNEPRLAVPGLNPHSGDDGLFGNEEKEEIFPAIIEARAEGINVNGPVGADSIFHLGLEGHYDAIISLYHDQGHIALKSRDFFGTVTMTLGLPFLRTSVDHGTAYDIAWQGHASEKSLVEAIRLAVNQLQNSL